MDPKNVLGTVRDDPPPRPREFCDCAAGKTLPDINCDNWCSYKSKGVREMVKEYKLYSSFNEVLRSLWAYCNHEYKEPLHLEFLVHQLPTENYSKRSDNYDMVLVPMESWKKISDFLRYPDLNLVRIMTLADGKDYIQLVDLDSQLRRFSGTVDEDSSDFRHKLTAEELESVVALYKFDSGWKKRINFMKNNLRRIFSDTMHDFHVDIPWVQYENDEPFERIPIKPFKFLHTFFNFEKVPKSCFEGERNCGHWEYITVHWCKDNGYCVEAEHYFRIMYHQLQDREPDCLLVHETDWRNFAEYSTLPTPHFEGLRYGPYVEVDIIFEQTLDWFKYLDENINGIRDWFELRNGKPFNCKQNDMFRQLPRCEFNRDQMYEAFDYLSNLAHRRNLSYKDVKDYHPDRELNESYLDVHSMLSDKFETMTIIDKPLDRTKPIYQQLEGLYLEMGIIEEAQLSKTQQGNIFVNLLLSMLPFFLF